MRTTLLLVLLLAALAVLGARAGGCPYLAAQAADDVGKVNDWGPHVFTVDCGAVADAEEAWFCQASVVLPTTELVKVTAGGSDEAAAEAKLEAVIADMLRVSYRQRLEKEAVLEVDL